MPGKPRSITRFGLLRHGKTVWNDEKRIQGSGDSPLTPEGIDTCRKWARFLAETTQPWHRILVSPLLRTRETAEIINAELHLPIDLEPGFREQDWGLWEGLSLPEIKAEFPGEVERRVQDGWDFRPPEGESRKEVLGRVLDSISRQVGKWGGQSLLVVTHLGVIKTLLYHLENREFLPQEPQIIWKDRFHIVAYEDNVLRVEQSNLSLADSP